MTAGERTELDGTGSARHCLCLQLNALPSAARGRRTRGVYFSLCAREEGEARPHATDERAHKPAAVAEAQEPELRRVATEPAGKHVE